MAGLIEQQMPGVAPAPAMADSPQSPPQRGRMPPDRGMENEAAETGPETDIDPDSDPGYVSALKFAMQALYENGAAKGIAKSLRTTQDPAEGLASAAYEIISIVEDRTQRAVPDELLVLFATKILEEVADIAEAAGIKVMPADVALAFKQMVLRYMGEQGVDTTQLSQAMDQVDPQEFNRAAAEEA